MMLGNGEPSCETGDSQRGQEPLNMEAQGCTMLEAVMRQLVKAQQTEKA
jgi:hypothetical protein